MVELELVLRVHLIFFKALFLYLRVYFMPLCVVGVREQLAGVRFLLLLIGFEN